MIGGWTNTANAGAGGTGDWAAVVNNNYSDLRLYQGIAAPTNGTQLTLSFDYVRPAASPARCSPGYDQRHVRAELGRRTVQGQVLFTYTLGTTASWTSVTNQGSPSTARSRI